MYLFCLIKYVFFIVFLKILKLSKPFFVFHNSSPCFIKIKNLLFQTLFFFIQAFIFEWDFVNTSLDSIVRPKSNPYETLHNLALVFLVHCDPIRFGIKFVPDFISSLILPHLLILFHKISFSFSHFMTRAQMSSNFQNI